ncbi:hypothetical protein BV22DRAFT_1020600 [Leucogyrophana mollusca]|uniref:Uncharacterized protein n=1 Tax=Leucogyrophana mollusca TaxID=85980 RepID=A0ACB8B7D4_9AGAM|nr:hypothetical protein BV22DRAFT_1020600 [Leucogyrophana mollusca]
MRSSAILVGFVFASLASAAVVSDNEAVDYQVDDSHNCHGSGLCSSLNVNDCNAAQRAIVPSNIYSTNGGRNSNGVCNGHCAIFVQGGSGCSYSGTDLNNAYSELRSAGCRKCGSVQFDNGCEITVNYVSSC